MIIKISLIIYIEKIWNIINILGFISILIKKKDISKYTYFK